MAGQLRIFDKDDQLRQRLSLKGNRIMIGAAVCDVLGIEHSVAQSVLIGGNARPDRIEAINTTGSIEAKGCYGLMPESVCEIATTVAENRDRGQSIALTTN